MTSTSPDSAETESTRISRRGWLFLGALGLSIAGTAWGFLDATSIAVIDGGTDEGSVYAGLFVSLGLVFTAITVPLVPRACRLLGETGAFSLSRWGMVVSTIAVGLVILAGFADERVLLIYAPFYGVFVGLALVLNPLFASRMMGKAGMARAYARLSVVGGLAWAIGALVGGWITDHTSSGWGLLAMGIAAIPLALLTVARAERGETAGDPHDAKETATEVKPKRGPRASLAALRANPALLKITVFAAAIAFFASPLVSLIVPIADELYHRTFITSASIMMAGLSVGEMLTPVLVGGLKKRFNDLHGAAVASLACGLLLIVFTLDALFFQGNVELAFWVALSLAFGGARYASRALALGAASTSRPGESEVSTMSIYFLAVMVTAPIGVAWWSLMIEYVNVVSALLVGAAGTIAISLWLLRQPQVSRPPRAIQ